MAIAVIAGLGNPGARYRGTRHSIGFQVIEAFAVRVDGTDWKEERRFRADVIRRDVGDRRCFLVRPRTYMNESGWCIAALCHYHRIPPPSVAVIYDEVNVELGRVKVSVSGSAGGHNGVEDLLEHLGEGFVRYRLGIGPKNPEQIDLKDFVLGRFTPYEQEVVNKKMSDFVDGLQLLVDRGPVVAMNRINQRNRRDNDDADREEE